MTILEKLKEFIKIFLKSFIFYVKRIYIKYEEDQVWLLSSGVAFSIILVILPFTLVILTVLGIYLDRNEVYLKINEYINQLFPLNVEYKEKFLQTIMLKIDEIKNYAVTTGILGFLGVVWTMSSLFSYMRDAMNRIYGINSTLSFVKGKLRDFMLLVITLLLFLSSTIITSFYQLSVNILKTIPILNTSGLFLYKFLPFILSYTISFLLFLILYSLIPNYKIPKKALYFSTIITSAIFELMKYLFTYYVLNISNYQYIYGTYAAIVITLLWIYIVSLIFCNGAVIGKIYIEKNSLAILDNNNKYGSKKALANN